MAHAAVDISPRIEANRDEASASDGDETSRWTPGTHAVLIALFLGVAAGAVAALYFTLLEAEGLGIPLLS